MVSVPSKLTGNPECSTGTGKSDARLSFKTRNAGFKFFIEILVTQSNFTSITPPEIYVGNSCFKLTKSQHCFCRLLQYFATRPWTTEFPYGANESLKAIVMIFFVKFTNAETM